MRAIPLPRRAWFTAIVLTGLLLAALTVPAGAASPYTGATQQTAAASCWEIKQDNPSATDGVYWLLTPQLQVPTQFYCDMTTDGGGWVLIGRGRENWTYGFDGRGTPEEVAGTVTGQGAFSPRQLDGDIIDALLGGRRFDSFADGVRLRRAANTEGTAWQEIRFTYKSRDRWTWALGAGIPIRTFSIDGATGGNTSTYDFGTNSGDRRVWTFESSSNGWVRGFNYGQSVRGSTAAGSYIYSKTSGGAYGTPFTQIFIRPTLRTSDLSYASIPDSGTAAQTIKAVPQSGAMTATWGVTGTGAAGTGENATEVQAFAQIGNTMYVGGNFTTVQKGQDAIGADKVTQRYLAAFDATTGDFISGFSPPTFNNQVKSLAALPDGRLAVGGEFTTVNGLPRAGLVVLDGTTGALDPTWTTNVVNRLTGGKVSVRGLDTDGTYLYVGGSFTHFLREGSEVYAKGGARLAISTGIADRHWNPELNGTATALDVSDDRTRVYFAGYFTKSGDVTTDRAAAFSTESGAALVSGAWQPTFSTRGSARYQQAIGQVGDRVWLGGSQHSMFAYDTTTFALRNAHITRSGGDLQAITGGNGLVFGGCHCENWNYSDTTDYDSLSIGSSNVAWSQADKIYYVGAWDATTGDYVPQFSPEMRARNGMGAWALKVASDGTLWAGGSLISAVKENGVNQWVGGFVRFAARPHTAPDAPSDLTVTLTDGVAHASWSGGSRGDVTYEVLRGDRVVATTTSTSVDIAGSSEGDRFFVRTADDWDNRSASTPVATPTAPGTTLLPSGATWSYHFADDTLPTSWKQPAYDDDSWDRGVAPLGWGSSTIATNIDPGGTRPLTSYHRTSFELPAGSTFGTVTLTARVDDGVAVYVNGTEVGRSNLPEGTLTAGTYADSAISATTAAANPVTFEVPVSVLRIGTNTVAVEVHSNYRATNSTSMDVSIVATAGSSAPSTTSTDNLVAAGSTWSYLFDRDTVLPQTWAQADFDASSWASGPAPLGWGSSVIRTNIDVPAGQPRALTSYYRQQFEVERPSAYDSVTVTTHADDGIAVYINGTEVGRSNLPEGTLTSGSYALSGVNTAVSMADPVTFDVPVSLLRAGANTVAVEVHSNYRATNSTSMQLSIRATSH